MLSNTSLKVFPDCLKQISREAIEMLSNVYAGVKVVCGLLGTLQSFVQYERPQDDGRQGRRRVAVTWGIRGDVQ
jgi:hypothetical protein